PPHPGDGDVPLSFAQEQLWVLDQLAPGDPAYNIGGAVRFHGALDTAALEQALHAIVSRHDILRTTFAARAGHPIQVVAPAPAARLRLTDLSALPPQERDGKARELAVEEARGPFDLARGPLLRVRLLRLCADDHLLLLAVHHIVADGWSMRVL